MANWTPPIVCAVVMGVFGFLAALVLMTTYGVFELVPHAPFTHRDIASGVLLIVFSISGAIVGGLAVAGVAFVLALPCLACGDCCDIDF